MPANQKPDEVPPPLSTILAWCLEVLGERIVPAGNTFIWTGGGADTLVSNAANWSTGGVAPAPAPPGALDILEFTGVGAPLASRAATFDAAAAANPATIQIGPNYTSTLTISSNVAVGTLDVTSNLNPANSPAISVATGITLTVTQGTWRGGTLTGLGTLIVQDAPAASFTIDDDSTVSLAAAYRWAAGEPEHPGRCRFQHHHDHAIRCDELDGWIHRTADE